MNQPKPPPNIPQANPMRTGLHSDLAALLKPTIGDRLMGIFAAVVVICFTALVAGSTIKFLWWLFQ